MKQLTLRNLLTQAMHAVLASPFVVVASCGGVDLSGFDTPKCVGGNLSLDGLQPTMPVDYIELRDSLAGTIGTTGTKCKTATNQAACVAAVDNAMIPADQPGIYKSCGQVCRAGALITTQGDAVTVLASKSALDTLLSPYDTEQEAVLAALSTGETVSCTDKNQGAVQKVAGGFQVVTFSGSGCGSSDPVIQHLLFIDGNGVVSERSTYTLMSGNPNCVAGRRPAGLYPGACASRGDGAVGRHFALNSRLEAASVAAFRVLRDELIAHGAPARLQRRAARSACDEIRHTRITRRLARRYGTQPRPPSVHRGPVRSLEELACDNAVEGCVRETFGALFGMWQAQRAQDPAIARAMARIARDEMRHATLAWQVAAWVQPQLDPVAQARVAAARRTAITTLHNELLTPPAPELIASAGVPARKDALALLAQLEQLLWKDATAQRPT